MLQLERQAASRTSHRLTVQIARTQDQIRAAQALRYKVFAEEMGAQLTSSEPGIDEDLFDAYCDHLIAINDETGEVVGTYRILPPHQAKRLGSYYSDTEFDLTRLASLRPHLVEVGRSCVHPEHRNGATIALLWSGLAAYMHEHDYHYLMGCASMSMVDGGHLAASLYQKLAQNHLAPTEWRVTPRCALPMQALNRSLDAETPPLIKGYLRAGAMVCGEPAWDPDFNTADFLILLPMRKVSSRYARHFMKNDAGSN